MEAAVLFDNGAPTQTGGLDLNTNLGADNFLLGSASQVTLLRYWTLQSEEGAYAGTTEWSLRTNAAGAPGSVVASGAGAATQTATGNSFFGLAEYEHSVAISANLAAGTYWLVLHNGPSSAQPTLDFMWGFSNDATGDAQGYELGVGPWGTVSAELAFLIEGTVGGGTGQVPEPGTVVLLATGLAAFGIYRQRRSA